MRMASAGPSLAWPGTPRCSPTSRLGSIWTYEELLYSSREEMRGAGGDAECRARCQGDAECRARCQGDACKFILNVTVCTNACKHNLTLSVDFILVRFHQCFFQGLEELWPFGRQYTPDQI